MTDLDDARAQHDADVERLAELDVEQIDYLAHLNEVWDPLSDGIDPDCA